MATLIDIHSHILPGLDDGAKDMLTSLEMMKIAYDNGIRDIILTPHYKPSHHNASAATINRLIEDLQELCIARGIKIRLYKGNELMYHFGVMEALDDGRANTLAGSGYILIEFNPSDDYNRIRDGIYDALSHGYTPILAHVERYESVMKDMDRVRELIGMGCYMQVNAGSVMGDFGRTAKKNVATMLKNNLVHFIASDAHSANRRSPAMLECFRYIIKKYGEDCERKLFITNPSCVIKNEPIK